MTRAFETFRTFAENQTGRNVKKLRTDNGKGYDNLGFRKLFSKLGIQHQTSNVHTPQQNGLAERFNRPIEERFMCMLADTGLPKSF